MSSWRAKVATTGIYHCRQISRIDSTQLDCAACALNSDEKQQCPANLLFTTVEAWTSGASASLTSQADCVLSIDCHGYLSFTEQDTQTAKETLQSPAIFGCTVTFTLLFHLLPHSRLNWRHSLVARICTYSLLWIGLPVSSRAHKVSKQIWSSAAISILLTMLLCLCSVCFRYLFLVRMIL